MRVDMSVTFTDRLPPVSRRTASLLSQVVRKTAFDIVTDARREVPVDTGALKNSIYVVTDRSSNYAQQQARADAAITKKQRAPRRHLPEVERPKAFEAFVAVGMEYGMAVEYGGHGRVAKPYLGPAVEATRNNFVTRCREAMRRGSTWA